jgi:imidazolonepropionase-like amidohydrolase
VGAAPHASTPQTLTTVVTKFAGDSVDSRAKEKQTSAILCGRLLDGTGKPPRENVAILVEGNKITGIVDRDAVPKGFKAIDLGAATVLPGLIDAHTHPLIGADDYQVDHLRHSSAYKTLRGLRRAQDALEAGWTSIRIAGDADTGYGALDLQRAIADGLFVGPRITAAGHYMSTTGGGGDINFISAEQSIVADGLVVDGPAEVQKAVRNEIKHGAQWIKLLVTGAFMSAGDDPRQVQFSDEELQAAVEEAKRRGVPVMAHAHSAEGIKRAVRAGVRSIEHGTFIDDEAIRLMKEHGTYLVPTLYIHDHFLEVYADSPHQKKMVELSKQYRVSYMRGIGRAIKEGVKVVVGSDAVGFSSASMHAREFAVLVEAGMSPMQAIEAGTRLAAELFGWQDELGTIEPGKLADLIAVQGNPLEDISELERVTFVMLDGKVVKR